MAKPTPELAAAGRGDHGVDADDLAMGVEQGAAGVAGIDGRVGLDGLVDVGSVGLLHLADGADDAARHGSVEDAEGIADGEHLLADLQVGAVAHGDRLQVGRLDLNDREVVRLVGSDDGGRIVLFVGQDDLELTGSIDDMVVGEDVSLFVDEEAGAGTLRGLGSEEEIIGDDGGGDVDHRGRDALVDVHVVLLIGVERRSGLGLGELHGVARDPRGGTGWNDGRCSRRTRLRAARLEQKVVELSWFGLIHLL